MKPYKLIQDKESKSLIFEYKLIKWFFLSLITILLIIGIIAVIIGSSGFRGMQLNLRIFYFIWMMLFLILEWFIVYPLKVELIKHKDNFIELNKRGPFFKKTHIKTKNAYLLAKEIKIEWVSKGFIWFRKPHPYRIFLNYKEDNEEKSIDLRPKLFYFMMESFGFRSVGRILNKEDVEEISKFLGIKVVYEKLEK
ncbi:MAG TPA: hypothetical protein VJH65_00735 [Candidatus Nanoarchaeia archaeon]|nr:hypothetical protein [Candidatus Nanoarchaeia archaeon]